VHKELQVLGHIDQKDKENGKYWTIPYSGLQDQAHKTLVKNNWFTAKSTNRRNFDWGQNNNVNITLEIHSLVIHSKDLFKAAGSDSGN